jgi:hypothetical protein
VISIQRPMTTLDHILERAGVLRQKLQSSRNTSAASTYPRPQQGTEPIPEMMQEASLVCKGEVTSAPTPTLGDNTPRMSGTAWVRLDRCFKGDVGRSPIPLAVDQYYALAGEPTFLPFLPTKDVRLAGLTPRTWMGEPPRDIHMRLPDKILNTACFFARDKTPVKYGGTGFVVGMQGVGNEAYLYLVTAKHVVEALGASSFLIGVNDKQGKQALIESQGPCQWYCHPTEPHAVDAAVTVFNPVGYEELNIEWIQDRQFATDDVVEKACIGIGDEIVAVGLFTRFSGQHSHWPIVRTGNLAMLPKEKVPTKGFDPMNVFLAEGRSIGGLSGSPVFVRQTVNHWLKDDNGDSYPFAGTGQIYFLGLMHGHWDVPAKFHNIEGLEAVNMGISVVVPAQKIMEILNHPDLVAERKKHDNVLPDSAI